MAVGALNAVNYESGSLYHLISQCGFATKQAVDSVHDNVGRGHSSFSSVGIPKDATSRGRAANSPAVVSDMREADRMILAGKKRRAVHVDETCVRGRCRLFIGIADAKSTSGSAN